MPTQYQLIAAQGMGSRRRRNLVLLIARFYLAHWLNGYTPNVAIILSQTKTTPTSAAFPDPSHATIPPIVSR
jgi:hypothetical protein